MPVTRGISTPSQHGKSAAKLMPHACSPPPVRYILWSSKRTLAMPRLRPSSAYDDSRITLRVDGEAYVFFRRQAKLQGKSLSDYLKTLLMDGLVNARVEEVEERLTRLVERIPDAGAAQTSQGISSEALLALFTIEAALEEILRQRDPAAWIKVLDKARRRLKSGARNDEP